MTMREKAVMSPKKRAGDTERTFRLEMVDDVIIPDQVVKEFGGLEAAKEKATIHCRAMMRKKLIGDVVSDMGPLLHQLGCHLGRWTESDGQGGSRPIKPTLSQDQIYDGLIDAFDRFQGVKS